MARWEKSSVLERSGVVSGKTSGRVRYRFWKRHKSFRKMFAFCGERKMTAPPRLAKERLEFSQGWEYAKRRAASKQREWFTEVGLA